MFVDKITLQAKAGNGGNGIVAFRREKYVPLGGPSGGDGGQGGSVIFEVDTNKSTLLDLRYQHHLNAQNGFNGRTKKMHGADGEDYIVQVPLGTLIKNSENGEVIGDLVEIGQRVIVAHGGKGGRGNYRFTTSRNNAPDYAEFGESGEELSITVELRVLADVGLVGFPSVGKSTLLSVVSKAKPEIADYHFTTLTPNLGMVEVGDGRSFVMADLPGLIEFASEGKGLGIQFLQHVERCKVLIHVIDMGGEDHRDPLSDYEIINNELTEYNPDLMKRPMIVAANKMDGDNATENLKRFKEAYPDVEVFETTTLINQGLKPVIYRAADLLEEQREFDAAIKAPISEEVVFGFEEEPENDFSIEKLEEGLWHFRSSRIDRRFKQIEFTDEHSAMRFAHTLKKFGVDEFMRNAGVQNGDTVIYQNIQFTFID
ncbi:MAG: GTPase ObgE [Erysipelothrix sp.]|nr:GTPase ObgE [Erysipelothrix sp.]